MYHYRVTLLHHWQHNPVSSNVVYITTEQPFSDADEDKVVIDVVEALPYELVETLMLTKVDSVDFLGKSP